MTKEPKSTSPVGALPPGTATAGGGLLSRWSARKADVACREAEDADTEAIRAQAEADRLVLEERQTANREAAEAVDIEKADYQTDFTPFLKDGVPAALRRQALKTLWRTNPLLANVDGLNDYDEDFRAVDEAFEAVNSSWEVGRGYAGKAEDVTREMQARDQSVAEAAEAERDKGENPGETAVSDELPGKQVDDQADANIVATDRAVEPAAEVSEPGEGGRSLPEADETPETVEIDAVPPVAEPLTGRASLRHRLLQNDR